jgi:lysozyme
MNLLEKAAQQLRLHEGVRKKPYKDTVGKLTIGVGRNLDDVGLSDDEINFLLKNDIEKVLTKLRELPYWNYLTDNRKLVLIDMAFNLGFAGLMGFKQTLKAVELKNYRLAAELMIISKWAKQVGKRAQTLADMMENG